MARDLRMGLDLDGCVYPWVETVKLAYKSRGYSGEGWDTPDIPTWDWLLEEGGVTKADWRWLWESQEGLQAAFGAVDSAYPGAIEAVQRISKVTDLAIITHRPRRVAGLTAAFLANHGIVFDSLHILGGKNPEKSRVQPQADVYIEDKVENVLDLLENTDAYAIYVPRRPWNQDGRLEERPGGRVRFFDNWSRVAAAIEQKAGRKAVAA